MTSAVLGDHVCEHFDVKSQTKRRCEIPCPQNCIVTEFGPWGDCDCHGNQTRTREVVTAPSGAGKPCPSLSEMRHCVEVPKAHEVHTKHEAHKISAVQRHVGTVPLTSPLEDMTPQDRRWWRRNQFTLFKREAPPPTPNKDEATSEAHRGCSHEDGNVKRRENWSECDPFDKAAERTHRKRSSAIVQFPPDVHVSYNQTVLLGTRVRRTLCRDSKGAILDLRCVALTLNYC